MQSSEPGMPGAAAAGAPAVDPDLQKLLTQGETIRRFAAGADGEISARAPTVSGWSVGQHLEHMALVGLWVVDAVNGLAARPDEPPGGRPTLPGWVHVLTGWIPRGRVQAAKPVSPETDDPAAARAAVAKYRDGLASLPVRTDAIDAARGTRSHPALGHLTARRWLRFLHNHQGHHLRIIDEIRTAASADTSADGPQPGSAA